ncbi:MAG TPA: SGNH hydrolase domain-containing protein [Jatrophihabitans sp.]|nr:SGNH hydrolase domain-containing protein [Jatrophihabitans sp.]
MRLVELLAATATALLVSSFVSGSAHAVLVGADAGRASPLPSAESAGRTLIGAEVLGTPYAPHRPQDTARYISPRPAKSYTSKPENGRCISHFAVTDQTRCTFGDLRSHTTIFLVGDSHVMQWEPALKVAARQHGWKLVTDAKWACPFNAREVLLGHHEYASCLQWNRTVLHTVLHAHPTLVLTSAMKYRVADANGHPLSYARSKPHLVAGYEKWWRRLHRRGIPITVLADTPKPDFDIDGCVAAHRNHLRACARDKSRYSWQGGQALAQAAKRTAFVHRLSFNDLLCPWERCPAVLADILLWRGHSNHITATYAYTAKRQVAHRLAAVLRR